MDDKQLPDSKEFFIRKKFEKKKPAPHPKILVLYHKFLYTNSIFMFQILYDNLV